MQSKENKYFAPFNLTSIFLVLSKEYKLIKLYSVGWWILHPFTLSFIHHHNIRRDVFFHFGCIQLPCCISFKEISSIDWFDCACHRFDEPFIIHRHDHFVFRLTHQKLKNFCNVMRIETKKIHTEKKKKKIKAERKS